MTLTPLEQQICNQLQNGLPICQKPFDVLAKNLDTDRQTFLKVANQLRADGLIRRFGAMINYHAMGKTATLVTAHVPQDKIDQIANFINAFNDVSHNYLRGDHYYNLWFTLQGDSEQHIDQMLKDMQQRFGIDFHSLPAKRFFKLDVRFDAAGGNIASAQVKPPVKNKTVTLTDNEKQIVSKLQTIEFIENPFDFLADKNFQIPDILKTIDTLVSKGAIKRIAALVDHRKLGFTANVMFVCQVDSDKILESANSLISCPMVTHCYERKTFQNWPYNLFAMMHARKKEQIEQFVKEFVQKNQINSYQLLSTIAELKKEQVVYNLKKD